MNRNQKALPWVAIVSQAPVALRAAGCIAMGGWLLAVAAVQAAPTWGVNPANSTLTIDGDTYADNGTNGFKLGGVWDEDFLTTNAFQSGFVVGPDTFDLGAAVNPISRDAGGPPPWTTTASAVGLITIHGLGTNTLEINWRANTLSDHFHGEGFLSDSAANVISQIEASINGVAPGAPVTVGYDWEYFATAVPDHEAINEDPELARGSLSLVDDQGTGPGNLFNVLVAEPGLLTSIDDDNDSYSLTTSNPMSFVTIDLNASSVITMDNPGTPPPPDFDDQDLAGSEFIGRLTLTLTVVPEPSGVALALLGLLAGSRFVTRRRS